MNSGSWFWPDVSTLDGAEDACRLAKWCALAISGLAALPVLFALISMRFTVASVATLLEAAIFGAIAFGLEKHSRVAAVAGFVLYLADRIYMIAHTGSFLGAGALGIVILIGFLNGMRGAFAIARLKNHAEAAAGAPATH